jgi:sugar phosphate isomerase/epimerase
MTTPTLALAHLTILGTPPPVMATLAAAAGYRSIGIRLLPATTSEIRHDMGPDSYLLKETRKALEDTGITVLDVEALSLDSKISRDDWLVALDVAHQLGASVLNVIGSDWTRDRLIERFAALAADAEEFGVRASLEPISYQAVSTIEDASSIVTEVGRGGIMLDTLHFQRAGSQPEDIDNVPLAQFSMVQLSDGPIAERKEVAIPANDPMGQKEGATARELESRVLRDLPGDGEFPLVPLLRKLGPTIPVSVEVPNPALVEHLGEADYIKLAYRKAISLLHDAYEAPAPEAVPTNQRYLAGVASHPTDDRWDKR